MGRFGGNNSITHAFLAWPCSTFSSPSLPTSTAPHSCRDSKPAYTATLTARRTGESLASLLFGRAVSRATFLPPLVALTLPPHPNRVPVDQNRMIHHGSPFHSFCFESLFFYHRKCLRLGEYGHCVTRSTMKEQNGKRKKKNNQGSVGL